MSNTCSAAERIILKQPRTTIYGMVTIAISWLFFVGFSACSGQPDINDCKQSLKVASNDLDAYYTTPHQAPLLKSLSHAEKALQCPETRPKAIEQKISLLLLIGNYRAGYKFIDSLDEDDFAEKYKKSMNSNIFRAFEYESVGDTANADKLYIETINDLNNYLNVSDTNTKALDQEIFYDLFFVKGRLLSPEQINAELDSMANIYPMHKKLFLVLRSGEQTGGTEIISTKE